MKIAYSFDVIKYNAKKRLRDALINRKKNSVTFFVVPRSNLILICTNNTVYERECLVFLLAQILVLQVKRQKSYSLLNKMVFIDNIYVRTKGYSTDLLDPTQVESKNTIVKSNGLSRVLMLNLWIFSLEKNKSENSCLNI